MKKLSKDLSAYLAGFLDGDGSVYVKLTKNSSYKYLFQVSAYIAFFQSDKQENFLKKLRDSAGVGYLRKRKDGIVEWIIGDEQSQLDLAKTLLPFSKLKKKQLRLLSEIIYQKREISSASKFIDLCRLIDKFKQLNYSKKRTITASLVEKVLIDKKLLTP